MDAYFALVSVRVVREYAETPLPEDALERILQAGRTTGSSQNRQPWRFFVTNSRERLRTLADTIYAPANLAGCQAAVAVTTPTGASFDAGRCTQNMILAAWEDGIGSCPNGVREQDRARQILRVPNGETIATILSLGYPLHPRAPKADDVDGVLKRIKRKPLDDLVVRVD